jgi:hypothetical protein
MSDITELINDQSDIVYSLDTDPSLVGWLSDRIPGWCDGSSFGTYTYTLTTTDDNDGYFGSSISVSATDVTLHLPTTAGGVRVTYSYTVSL